MPLRNWRIKNDNNVFNMGNHGDHDYYNKYYTPDNMNLVITGDVNPDEVIQLVAKNFNSSKISTGKKFEEKLVPLNKTVRKDFKNDKAVSTEIVLGFSGPANNDLKENVLFDTAKTYLESYTSGLKQNLKRFNSYPYIDSEKIRCIIYAYITDRNSTKRILPVGGVLYIPFWGVQ